VDKRRCSADSNDSSIRALAFETDSNASTFLVDVICDVMVIFDLIQEMTWLHEITEKSVLGLSYLSIVD
jgi:hypothetical protein